MRTKLPVGGLPRCSGPLWMQANSGTAELTVHRASIAIRERQRDRCQLVRPAWSLRVSIYIDCEWWGGHMYDGGLPNCCAYTNCSRQQCPLMHATHDLWFHHDLGDCNSPGFVYCVPFEPIDVGSIRGSVLCLMVLRSTAESEQEELPPNYQRFSLGGKPGSPSLQMMDCPILADSSSYVLGTVTHKLKNAFTCF